MEHIENATESAADVRPDKIDLSELDFRAAAEQGEWMTVTHPITGIEMPGMRLRVCGVDSDRYQKAEKAMLSRRMRQRRQALGEDLDLDSLEVQARCVTAWEGIEEGGRPVDHSHKAVVAVLTKHRWLRDQVERFIQDRGNFTKKG